MDDAVQDVEQGMMVQQGSVGPASIEIVAGKPDHHVFSNDTRADNPGTAAIAPAAQRA